MDPALVKYNSMLSLKPSYLRNSLIGAVYTVISALKFAFSPHFLLI